MCIDLVTGLRKDKIVFFLFIAPNLVDISSENSGAYEHSSKWTLPLRRAEPNPRAVCARAHSRAIRSRENTENVAFESFARELRSEMFRHVEKC